MPTWWGGKSHSKEGNKRSKESILSTIQRKLRNSEDTRKSSSSTGSGLHHNTGISKPYLPHVQSQSEEPLPTHVSESSIFIDTPKAQPLPLPLPIVGRVSAPSTPTFVRLSNPKPYSPFKKHDNLQNEVNPMNYGCDRPMALGFSDSYTDSEDPGDSSHPLSPQLPDYEIGVLTPMRSQSRAMMKKNQPFFMARNVSGGVTMVDHKEKNRFTNISHSHQIVDLPLPNLQSPQSKVLNSVPDSLNSSPSRSPLRVSVNGLYSGTSLWAIKPCPDASLMGSGHCSSPGSVYNSGHNSVGGDLFWQNTRCSPDYSAIPSPIAAASSSSSRAQSGTVSPLHLRAGGTIGDPTVNRQDDKKQRSHRLPLPPIIVSRTSTFSPSYSGATSPSPSIPRSPVMAENFTNFGSHWKKGRMIGSGTFGHVYLGFNSESGEMCAMKEVTLLSDDSKSKESVQQLVQELSLLGRLRHPNIVQHYGSGMINDKLYIYLEYVSGGSIHRLLQEYGQFGEMAIRNYTHQILSGLAYLHSKNTVHRDIKGANILVDPSGRVKLADFGMAKHIFGHSCPFSFKGSPYWMAPEVIKNSKGCNFSVDIWSLGCTVLEMATTKPPWSQYEGVAAIFKIGSSRDLPSIPYHLSNEGKDFVKRCLQRDPAMRPTADNLLLHPFVRFQRNPITPPHSFELPQKTLSTTSRIPGVEVDSFDQSQTIAGLRVLQLKSVESPLQYSVSPPMMSASPISSRRAASCYSSTTKTTPISSGGTIAV